MSMWCECENCCGTDKYVICENNLAEAWIMAYKQTPIIPEALNNNNKKFLKYISTFLLIILFCFL